MFQTTHDQLVFPHRRRKSNSLALSNDRVPTQLTDNSKTLNKDGPITKKCNNKLISMININKGNKNNKNNNISANMGLNIRECFSFFIGLHGFLYNYFFSLHYTGDRFLCLLPDIAVHDPINRE